MKTLSPAESRTETMIHGIARTNVDLLISPLQWAQSPFRITSYSIHYTKLYEWSGRGKVAAGWHLPGPEP